ncbi:hypothetical protein NDU88_011264 [Pleurodeles waltl]|uniref:Uncharacterized protein n=1 Tax=Pleurodeles waltl TaxID=8319 RepID=A0AAV7Q2L8_PLEWA|nr:hypothetical protein NDU88_011264 [Pleurodeles waltl]
MPDSRGQGRSASVLAAGKEPLSERHIRDSAAVCQGETQTSGTQSTAGGMGARWCWQTGTACWGAPVSWGVERQLLREEIKQQVALVPAGLLGRARVLGSGQLLRAPADPPGQAVVRRAGFGQRAAGKGASRPPGEAVVRRAGFGQRAAGEGACRPPWAGRGAAGKVWAEGSWQGR